MKKYKGYTYPTTIEELEKYGTLDEARIEIDGVDVLVRVNDALPPGASAGDLTVETVVGEAVKEYIDATMCQVDTVISSMKEVADDTKARMEEKLKTMKIESGSKEEPVEVTEEEIQEGVPDLDSITEQLDEVVLNDPKLAAIAGLPSNNGVSERSKEDIEAGEKGEMKAMQTSIDPNSGEVAVVGSLEELSDQIEEDTFEKILGDIDNIDINTTPGDLKVEDVMDYLSKENPTTKSMISEISDEANISEESIRCILDIANRRSSGEDFSVYKAFTPEIRKMVDDYIQKIGTAPMDQSVQAKTLRNRISESLIDDFISNVSYEKMKTDFTKEIESIFEQGTKDIAEKVIGYTKAKNQAYREAAEKIEDPEKKAKLLAVLDSIDEAYNLTGLKNFSKKCKIKKFDLEKPQRYYEEFKDKYTDSAYNIYDINMARPILYRSLNKVTPDEYSDKDVDAFFVCFCKQVQNYSEKDVIQHAYMYYLLYNIVLYDLNSKLEEGDSEFVQNVKEIINNLRLKVNY